MPILEFALIPAPDEPLSQRLLVLAFCLAFGGWMIHVGRLNVLARTAQESAKSALIMTLLRQSTEKHGRSAVITGWIRIVVGVFAIGFGFVFLFYGAFLK